jgi:hypothetical protein
MVSIIDRLRTGCRGLLSSIGVPWRQPRHLQCSGSCTPVSGCLYLGYWIAQSRKMAYKINFRPIEGLINGHWQHLPPGTI